MRKAEQLNANNDSLSLSKAGFCSSVLDQMRLVRDLEIMGEEAQVIFPVLFLKLKKLMVELNQLFEIMQNYCDN
jgi:hypothetical protein